MIDRYNVDTVLSAVRNEAWKTTGDLNISSFTTQAEGRIYLALTANTYGCVWFGLVYLFIHSVTYLTLDTSVTDYYLQHNL
jgi:hypothetical protein